MPSKYYLPVLMTHIIRLKCSLKIVATDRCVRRVSR